jgi:pheromone shutdown-related protein TraB
MGLDGGAKPGEEMKEAIRLCGELGIPFSLIDRDIQVTLRRAWSKSSFWGKNKILAALLSSAFTSEKLSTEQIEDLKKKSALHGMMEELGAYLPSVKGVLIDERDQHLACRLFEADGSTLVAVVGAGHVAGMVRWLTELHAGKASSDVTEISTVPQGAPVGKILGLVIPLAIVGLLVAGFVTGGWQVGLSKLLTWLLWNGGLAALGTLLALGHPLSILAAFVGAPIATLNPFIGVGLFAAGVEVFIRKPRVSDLENLQADITTLRGFYRNRVTRVLLIFVLSSLGGVVGNIISIPAIFPH